MKAPAKKSMIALSENEIDQKMKQVTATDNDELFSGFRAAPDSKQKKLTPPPSSSTQS